MVLRKPYAFFIKHFKLFHIILSALVIYSIYRITGVVNFINSYMESNDGIITITDFNKVFGAIDFIVPIVTLMFSILLLVVMGMKKKPNKFYAFSTMMTIILLVVNIYGYSTLKELTTVWLDVNKINTLGDIYIFVLLGCIVQTAVSISRAIGFNVSRFDFNNDILKLELSEEDNEEFEFMVDFDVNDLKRDAQKRLRYFRYFVKANKKTIIYSFVGLIAFVGLFIGFSFYKNNKNVVSLTRFKGINNGFSITLNNSYIVDSDSNGNKLADNKHLIVLDVTIKNRDEKNEKQFITGTIGINIGEDNYSVTKKYRNAVKDLGTMYSDENIKPSKEVRRLLIFEVPENRLNSKIYFTLRNLATKEDMYAKINPINLSKSSSEKVEKKLGEELVIQDSIVGESKLTLNSIDMATYYTVNYKYCTSSNKTCVDSIEYLIPDNSYTNYNKVILKLDGSFNIDSDGSIKSMYNLLSNYGYIEYEIGDKKYTQTTGLEQIISKKSSTKGTYYIGVDEKISTADKITLVFKLREKEYRYTIKERG